MLHVDLVTTLCFLVVWAVVNQFVSMCWPCPSLYLVNWVSPCEITLKPRKGTSNFFVALAWYWLWGRGSGHLGAPSVGYVSQLVRHKWFGFNVTRDWGLIRGHCCWTNINCKCGGRDVLAIATPLAVDAARLWLHVVVDVVTAKPCSSDTCSLNHGNLSAFIHKSCVDE